MLHCAVYKMVLTRLLMSIEEGVDTESSAVTVDCNELSF